MGSEMCIRDRSKDLGQYSLEGSRPGMAMLVHAAFHIIGRNGYEILIDQSIEKARVFAKLIKQHPEFELITDPELSILNYRYVPADIQDALTKADSSLQALINEKLDKVTRRMQKQQRAAGKTFVSRTRFSQPKYSGLPVSVFRVVLANPMTTVETLKSILVEQVALAERDGTKAILAEIRALLVDL